MGIARSPFLETAFILGLFGEDGASARHALAAFVDDGLRMGGELDGGTVDEKLAALAGRVAQAGGISLAELRGPSRARGTSELRQIFAYLARRNGIATVSDCAVYLGRAPSTLARTLAAFEARMVGNEDLQSRVRKI